MNNFLTNAIKYSPEADTLEISESSKNNAVEFMVRDSGKGIEEKYLPKIFDRYSKVSESSKTETGPGMLFQKNLLRRRVAEFSCRVK